MDVAVDAHTESQVTNWGTSETVSMPIASGSAAGRAVLVLIHWEGATFTYRPTAASYGNTAMTLFGDIYVDDTFDAGVVAFWLPDSSLPSSSGSYDLDITFGAAGKATSQCTVSLNELSGTSEATPTNIVTHEAVSVAAISKGITPDAADSFFIGAVATGAVVNVAPDQGTELYESDPSSSTGAAWEYTHTGSAAFDIGCTFNGTANRCALLGMEIEAAPIAGIDPLGAGMGLGALDVEYTLDPAGIGAALGTLGPEYQLAPLEVGSSLALLAAEYELIPLAAGLGLGTLLIDGALTALHRINSGGLEFTDSQGQVWDADRDFGAGTNTFSTGTAIAGTVDDTLYQTDRGVVSSGTQFGVDYTLAVPDATPVIVRFHLAEIWTGITAAGQRQFELFIDGVSVEPTVDLYADPGPFTAGVFEYPVTTSGTTIVLRAKNSGLQKAKINAVEVLAGTAGLGLSPLGVGAALGGLEAEYELVPLGAGVDLGDVAAELTLDSLGVGAGLGGLDVEHELEALGVGAGLGQLDMDLSLSPLEVGAELGALEAEYELASLSVGVGLGPLMIEGGGVGDDLVVTPTRDSQQVFTAPVGGTASPGTFTITIQNPSAAAIRWRAKSTVEWIELDETFGELAGGATVQVTARSDATGLAEDDYNGFVCVAGIDRSDHNVEVIPVRMVIGAGYVATGTTYYVDPVDGNDNNLGTSTAQSWANLPWDASGGSVSGGTSLGAGNEVRLKGGTRYRQQSYAGDSGSSGNPIVLDGNTRRDWGAGPAHWDASQVIPSWVDQGGGIYRASISGFETGSPFSVNLYDGDQPMAPSQWPVKQPDLYLWDDLKDLWPSFSDPDYGGHTSTTLIYDRFDELPSDFWETAYIAGWITGNAVAVEKITGYNPVTKQITFDSVNWITSQTPRFVILNSRAFLTDPGEYVLDESNQQIDIVPLDGSDRSNVTRTANNYNLECGAEQHVKVRGFVLEKAGGNSTYGRGSAVRSLAGTAGQYWDFEGNEFTRNRSPNGDGVLNIRKNTGMVVRGNAIYQNRQSRGMHLVNGIGGTGATDYVARRNYLFANGNTGIYTSGSDGVEMIENEVLRHSGTHGNGLSAYSGSVGTLIRGNVVREGNIALTLQPQGSGGDIRVEFNELDTTQDFIGRTVAIYSSAAADGVEFYNNTILSPSGTAVIASDGAGANWDWQNNIIDGMSVGGVGSMSYGNNIFTDTWDASVPISGSNQLVTDRSSIFVDPSYNGTDFRLKSGSAAIDSGASLGLTHRPAVGQRDIGAYEFQTGEPELSPLAMGAQLGDLEAEYELSPLGAGAGLGQLSESQDLNPLEAGATLGELEAEYELGSLGIGAGLGPLTPEGGVSPLSAGMGLGQLEVEYQLGPLAVGAELSALEVELELPVLEAGMELGLIEVGDPELKSIGVGAELGSLLVEYELSPLSAGLGLGPVEGDLELEEVPDYLSETIFHALMSPFMGEDILWQPPGGPERKIRAHVNRDYDQQIQGNATRFTVEILIEHHPTRGTETVEARSDFYFKTRRQQDSRLERFRVSQLNTDGRGGFWLLEGVSVE